MYHIDHYLLIARFLHLIRPNAVNFSSRLLLSSLSFTIDFETDLISSKHLMSILNLKPHFEKNFLISFTVVTFLLVLTTE